MTCTGLSPTSLSIECLLGKITLHDKGWRQPMQDAEKSEVLKFDAGSHSFYRVVAFSEGADVIYEVQITRLRLIEEAQVVAVSFSNQQIAMYSSDDYSQFKLESVARERALSVAQRHLDGGSLGEHCL
jgi:hypothetical protein